jgi:hypothetical protein
MYFIPGTPLIALSNGTIAAFVTVSAFAPVYSMVTFTSGGAMAGNCVMGNFSIAKTPNRLIIKDITIDNMGLLIKSRVIIVDCLAHTPSSHDGAQLLRKSFGGLCNEKLTPSQVGKLVGHTSSSG